MNISIEKVKRDFKSKIFEKNVLSIYRENEKIFIPQTLKSKLQQNKIPP